MVQDAQQGTSPPDAWGFILFIDQLFRLAG
jgi:hypothetical protein